MDSTHFQHGSPVHPVPRHGSLLILLLNQHEQNRR